MRSESEESRQLQVYDLATGCVIVLFTKKGDIKGRAVGVWHVDTFGAVEMETPEGLLRGDVR